MYDADLLIRGWFDSEYLAEQIPQRAAKALTVNFKIQRAVSDSVTPTYSVKAPVADNFSPSYNVRQRVANAQAFNFNIIAPEWTLLGSAVTQSGGNLAVTMTRDQDINTIIVVAHRAAGVVTQTCTDSKGNTYQQDVYFSGTNSQAVSSCKPATLLKVGDVVTVNISGGASWRSALVYQVSNLDQTNWFKQGTSAGGSGATMDSGISTLPIGKYALFGMGAFGSSGTMTAGGNGQGGTYRLLDNQLNPPGGQTMSTEYMSAAPASSLAYKAIGTNSTGTGWGMIFAAYNQGAPVVLASQSFGYKITGKVLKSQAVGYSVQKTIVQITAPSYTVRKVVTKAATLNYTVRASVAKTVALNYTVRAFLVDTLAISYKVIRQVAKTVALNYSVRAYTADAVALSYFIRVRVAASTVTPTYTVRSITVKALAPTYTVVGRILKSWAFSYNISPSGIWKPLTLNYTVRGRVTVKSVVLAYSVIQRILKTTPVNYALRGMISKTLSTAYKTRIVVSDSFATNYTVKHAIVKTVAPSYTVIGQITKSFSVSFPIYSGGFLPDQISGLASWLDASQLGLADGAAVNSWPNLSGGVNPSIVGTPVPTMKFGSSISGKPVVRFKAGEGRVRSAWATGVNDWTVLYVVRLWGPTAGRAFSVQFPPSNLLIGMHTTLQDTMYDNGTWIGGASWPGPGPLPWKMYEGDSKSAVGTRFFIDGTLIGSASGSGGFTNGWGLSGFDSTAGETADIEIGELVIYNRQLTGPERQLVEGYLRQKWFVTTVPVWKFQTMDWTTFKTISKTVVPAFTTVGRIQKFVTVNFTIRPPSVKVALPMQYLVLGKISQTFNYTVVQRVAKTLPISYNVRARFAKSLPLNFNVRVRLAKLLPLSYKTRITVSDSYVVSYRLINTISKSRSFSYTVYRLAAKQVTPSYLVKQRVPQALTALYRLRRQVSKPLTASYVVRRQATRVFTVSYRLRIVLAKPPRFTYAVRQQVKVVTGISYRLHVARAKPLVLTYKLQAQVRRSVTPAFGVAGHQRVVLVLNYKIRTDMLVPGTDPLSGNFKAALLSAGIPNWAGAWK